MSALLDQQQLFMRLLPRLIDAAHDLGYECTAGELYRTSEQAALNAKSGKGIANSLHTQRLAIDIQLFEGSSYLTHQAPYEAVGKVWETLHPSCAAGFRFGDPNHFSLAWEGRK